MEAKIDLQCLHCGIKFPRRSTEHKRSVRLGRGHYCTQTCQVKHTSLGNLRPHPENLIMNNRKDEYSPFRWFLRVVQKRHKKKGPTNLDLVYLKKLWEKQHGICPITGWKLILPRSSEGWSRGKNQRNASLDRIDNSIGYLKDNVRYISIMANYARNSFADQDVLEFCKTVVQYQAT